MPLVSIRAPASGMWRADVGSLTVGDTAADVRQAIGGETSADAAVTLRRRPPPPAMLVVRAPRAIHTLGYGPELGGTGAAGADVLVTANGAEVDTITVGLDGIWSIDLSVLGGGWWDLAFVQQTSLGTFPPVRRVLSVQPYSVETVAVLSRYVTLGTPASKARSDVLEGFVAALKGAGVWTHLVGAWCFAAHSEAAARVNIVSPGMFDIVPAGAVVPTHQVDRGYTGNGASGYLDSGINPTTVGGVIGQNSIAFGLRSLTSGASDAFDVATGDNIWMRTRSAGGQFSVRAGDDGSPQLAVANAEGIGHFAAVRSGSSARASYKDGAAVAADSEPSTTPTSSPITFLRRSGTYSSRQLASGFVGGALPAEKIAALAAADFAYAQAVGAA